MTSYSPQIAAAAVATFIQAPPSFTAGVTTFSTLFGLEKSIENLSNAVADSIDDEKSAIHTAVKIISSTALNALALYASMFAVSTALSFASVSVAAFSIKNACLTSSVSSLRALFFANKTTASQTESSHAKSFGILLQRDGDGFFYQNRFGTEHRLTKETPLEDPKIGDIFLSLNGDFFGILNDDLQIVRLDRDSCDRFKEAHLSTAPNTEISSRPLEGAGISLQRDLDGYFFKTPGGEVNRLEKEDPSTDPVRGHIFRNAQGVAFGILTDELGMMRLDKDNISRFKEGHASSEST